MKSLSIDDIAEHRLVWAKRLQEENRRLCEIINRAMQQHTVLAMREQLFESCCIDSEGQIESGHWEREEPDARGDDE